MINFELPQKTRDWEERILAYGDPDYITYWQNFPAGEEGSWESLIAWHENLWLLVLVAFPMVKGSKPIIGKAENVITAVKSVVKKTKHADEVAETLPQAVETVGKMTQQTKLSKYGAGYGDDVTVIATAKSASGVVKDPVAREVLENGISKNLDTMATKLGFTKSVSAMSARELDDLFAAAYKLKSGKVASWKIVAATVATGGAISVEGLTVSGWLLDKTMSVIAKFEPHPNNMVLKLPFFPVQKLGLGPDMMYKISVLDKPLMFDSTAYLASPCKANFEVEMDKCYCEKSSYRVVDKGEVWDGYEKKLYDLEDNSDTAIDETKDLDGMVSCDLVTQGHNMALFAEGVIPKSLEVLRTSEPKELLKNIME